MYVLLIFSVHLYNLNVICELLLYVLNGFFVFVRFNWCWDTHTYTSCEETFRNNTKKKKQEAKTNSVITFTITGSLYAPNKMNLSQIEHFSCTGIWLKWKFISVIFKFTRKSGNFLTITSSRTHTATIDTHRKIIK